MLKRPYGIAIKQLPVKLLFLSTFFIILTACSSGNIINTAPSRTPATSQLLRFPNVGMTNIAVLDPALGPDANSLLAVNLIDSGLGSSDKYSNVVHDLTTWRLAPDSHTYTFTLWTS